MTSHDSNCSDSWARPTSSGLCPPGNESNDARFIRSGTGREPAPPADCLPSRSRASWLSRMVLPARGSPSTTSRPRSDVRQYSAASSTDPADVHHRCARRTPRGVGRRRRPGAGRGILPAAARARPHPRCAATGQVLGGRLQPTATLPDPGVQRRHGRDNRDRKSRNRGEFPAAVLALSGSPPASRNEAAATAAPSTARWPMEAIKTTRKSSRPTETP